MPIFFMSGDGPKVTDPDLWFPSGFCEDQWFSAVSCALRMLQFPGEPGEGVNRQKSAIFCENLHFGPGLSP